MRSPLASFQVSLIGQFWVSPEGQNRYYWGVVVKEIAQHTGHDPEQVHEALKQMWSPKWHFGANVSVPSSTIRLDILAFLDYTEKCRMWANEF